MAHQANAAGQMAARVDSKFPDVPVAAGRKGFKAELDALRERMRGLGFSTDELIGYVSRGDVSAAGAWLRRPARDPGVNPWLLLDQLTAPDTGLSALHSRPLGGAWRAWYPSAVPDGGGLG